MEAFDLAVIGWLNGFSRTNPTFDEFVHLIASNDLLKGGLLMALLWSAWMRQDGRIITGELLAVRTIAGAFLAVVVGRGLQNMLPGRLRPMHEPAVDFVVPYYVGRPGCAQPDGLAGWSSFPSD